MALRTPGADCLPMAFRNIGSGSRAQPIESINVIGAMPLPIHL
jgi:hypothetical protein